jgi:hypothetical protein
MVEKMKFENKELDKEILDRLAGYGIFISRNCPPVNKEKALVLLGEAILDKFVKEFVSLWRNELFANCLLKDYEASAEEVHEWVHGGDPQYDCELCSNDCKGVNEKMDENIKGKLESYLELLSEIKEKTEDERTATVLLQEISKDQRMERIKQEREANNGSPATDKQKQFMKKLGIDFPRNVTKHEASALIDEELSKNDNGE